MTSRLRLIGKEDSGICAGEEWDAKVLRGIEVRQSIAVPQPASELYFIIYSFKFLSMYRQSRKRVHNRKSAANSSYPKSIAATFLLSLDKIKEGESGTQAVKLLQLFVFL